MTELSIVWSLDTSQLKWPQVCVSCWDFSSAEEEELVINIKKKWSFSNLVNVNSLRPCLYILKWQGEVNKGGFVNTMLVWTRCTSLTDIFFTQPLLIACLMAGDGLPLRTELRKLRSRTKGCSFTVGAEEINLEAWCAWWNMSEQHNIPGINLSISINYLWTIMNLLMETRHSALQEPAR